MFTGFNISSFIICTCLLIQINHGFHHHFHNIRKYRHIYANTDNNLNGSSAITESTRFFQNEPVPLAASVVDDLTTLASAVYIISLIVIIFIILAWITHYNAPCSSLITSVLSTITGLPEPIIHSVALCGSCCMWCERTWLFRRIHQFNVWISSKIQQFVSGSCKILYDTICPCCRPPDTPSNRSLIGSLPASVITRIPIPDTPKSTPPKARVTVFEPTSALSKPLNVNVYSQPKTESLIENEAYLSTKMSTIGIKAATNQTYQNKLTNKKRRKRSRRKVQLKQRTTFGESSVIDEQPDDISEEEDPNSDEQDSEEDDHGENIRIY